MPELPEVETIANGLNKRVAGATIESVWVGERKQPLKSSARAIATMLEGARIKHVRRVGKHIVADLEEENGEARGQWIIHLGMTGSTLVQDPATDIPKHTHLIAKISSGKEIRFVDPRMFGKLAVQSKAKVFAAPGLEPLQVSLEEFVKLFRGRNTPIKSALLNQKLLSGVGNIYADESLFRAGIRPRRKAKTLTRADLTRLREKLGEVLREAVEAGGSSVNDYVDSDGNEGFFQLRHNVYQRTGEPCLVCRTPIKRVVIGGRSSHFCSKCQK
ncbi:MAG TPA: DNA-formamidopyrimidine glycosylase [Candidatus Koribacter sp.]|jgi:formamidopyrimidine-DNA glycosylase